MLAPTVRSRYYYYSRYSPPIQLLLKHSTRRAPTALLQFPRLQTMSYYSIPLVCFVYSRGKIKRYSVATNSDHRLPRAFETRKVIELISLSSAICRASYPPSVSARLLRIGWGRQGEEESEVLKKLKKDGQLLDSYLKNGVDVVLIFYKVLLLSWKN